MSDLLRTLSRQLSRPQPGAGNIRPRARSRFEPYGEGLPSFGSGVAFGETEVAVPLAQPAPAQPSSSMQQRSEPRGRTETHPVTQPEHRENVGNITPVRETIREVVRSVDRSSLPMSPVMEPRVAHAQPVAITHPEREAVQAVFPLANEVRTPAAERAEAPQVQAIRPLAMPEDARPARGSSRLAERAPVPAHAPRSMPRLPAEDMARLRGSAAQAVAQNSQAPAGRQEITIEIGSIIVRGDVPERRASHDAAAPPARPALSLEHYLQHRGGTQ